MRRAGLWQEVRYLSGEGMGQKDERMEKAKGDNRRQQGRGARKDVQRVKCGRAPRLNKKFHILELGKANFFK